MTFSKLPMSISYKVVFALSILMIFVVIIGGALSGSKTLGFGIWYWGYTAWKMYKRDNDSLVSLQKFMLWFQAIAFSIALAVLLFSDSDVRKYVDITPLGIIILGSISILISYSLFVFFKKQSSADFIIGFSGRDDASLIDDKYWEKASIELSLKRNEAAWARSFAMSDGDEAKAKAMYIKTRALDLMKADVPVVFSTSSAHSKRKESIIFTEIKLFWNYFNSVGKIAIIGIIGLFTYSFISYLDLPRSDKWINVAEVNGNTHFFDKAHLQSTGRIRKVSALINYGTPNSSGALSSTATYEYDCQDRRMRILEGATFKKLNGRGEKKWVFKEPLDWASVTSSLHEKLLRVACAGN